MLEQEGYKNGAVVKLTISHSAVFAIALFFAQNFSIVSSNYPEQLERRIDFLEANCVLKE